MIPQLILLLHLALGISAHGDHTEGLHMGVEALTYYDEVPDNAFKKSDNGEILGTIKFKKRSLPIKLWQNDLDQTDQNNDNVYMSGVVTNIPGSYIRMNSFNNTMEGIISLPKRGLVRIALASRFDNINGKSNMIAYHSDDLQHLSKRSISHTEFWKPLDSYLWKRGLGRGQCQQKEVISAAMSVDKSLFNDVALESNNSQSEDLQLPLPIFNKAEASIVQSYQTANGATAQYQQYQNSGSVQAQSDPRYQYAQQPQYVQPQQSPQYAQPQQPQQPRYAQPQQPTYSQPQQPRYSQPQQPTYSQPQQPRYSQPQQPTYSQPQQPRYAQPQQPQQASRYVQTARPAAAQPAAVSRLTSCNAGLIADYSFYLQHRNQPGGIENYMQSLFNEVSGHFLAQTGVSLRIKYLYVVKNPNDGSGLGYNYADPSHSISYINSKSAKLPGFNAEDLCVVHILSSAKFTQQAVGVAFIGSVCSPGANAGISSDNYGKLSRSDFTSVIMHEIGHVFGSSHDTTFTSEKSICAPPKDRYVMYPSVQGGSKNAHRFSPCSLRSIQRTISNPKKQCWNLNGQRVRPGAKFANSKAEMIVDYLRSDL